MTRLGPLYNSARTEKISKLRERRVPTIGTYLSNLNL